MKTTFLSVFFIIGFISFANDNIEIKIKDYQYSKNLLSFQIKINNHTDKYIIIPEYISYDYKLVENELIITYFYNYIDGLEGGILFDVFDSFPEYIIEPDEEFYYSVFLKNEYIAIMNFALFDDDTKNDIRNKYNAYSPIEDVNGRIFYRSFNKIIGEIINVQINFEIIEGIDIDYLKTWKSSQYKGDWREINIDYKLNEPIIIVENYSYKIIRD